MRTMRGLLVMAFLLSWLATPLLGRDQVGARDECDGLDGYRKDILRTVESVGQDVDTLGLHDAGLEDLSPEVFEVVADAADAIAAGMGDIDPPGLMTEWHEKTIARFSLLAEMARVIAKDGFFAAFIFIDRITESDADLDRIERDIIAECPEAAVFLLDFEEGVEDDGPIDAPSAATAVSRGRSAEAGFDWTVTLNAVYTDPATIDPSATWFVDWLANNPRPAGKEFLTVRITATNTDDEPLDRLDFGYGYATPGGAVYNYRNTCGSVPDEWSYQTVIEPGESVTTTLCMVVDAGDLEELYFYVGDPRNEPTYYSLDS